MAKITLKKTYEYIDHDFTILVDGKPLMSKKYNNLKSSISFREYTTKNVYCCEVYFLYGESNVDSITIPTKKGDEQKVIKMLRPIIKYAVETILANYSE